MKIHRMHLHSEPFSLVKNGGKKIECRLNDEKRRTFAVGDQLIFKDRDTGEKLSSVITHLYRYATFSDLFDRHPLRAFGYSNKGELLLDIRQYYTEEDEKQFGVVGIEFTTTKII